MTRRNGVRHKGTKAQSYEEFKGLALHRLCASVPLCLCALVFLLSGCGYQNLTRQPVDFSVYFPILVNRTTEPGVEVVLTNAITRELLRSGITVAGEKEAEHLLSGAVISYVRVPISFRSDDPKEVNQYRLEVTVRLDITPPARSTNLTSFSNYFLTGPFRRSEAAALNTLASDLAQKSTEWITQQ